MRVLIAAKQAALGNALETLLQTRPGLEIAGTVSNKEQLFVQVEAASLDLLLLDEDLTEQLVEDIIDPLQQLDFCPMVVVLGGRSESGKAALDAGVVAFINKGDSPKSLLTAIEGLRLRGKRV